MLAHATYQKTALEQPPQTPLGYNRHLTTKPYTKARAASWISVWSKCSGLYRRRGFATSLLYPYCVRGLQAFSLIRVYIIDLRPMKRHAVNILPPFPLKSRFSRSDHKNRNMY